MILYYDFLNRCFSIICWVFHLPGGHYIYKASKAMHNSNAANISGYYGSSKDDIFFLLQVIKVDHEAHGVDTPEDVEKIESFMRERNLS